MNDLAWETKSGRFIVSVSSDQTTRLHAPWVQPNTQQVLRSVTRNNVQHVLFEHVCNVKGYLFSIIDFNMMWWIILVNM